MDIYYSLTKHCRTDAEGNPLQPSERIPLVYGQYATMTFHLDMFPDNVVSWHAAVGENGNQPLCRTLDSMIDSSQESEGILAMLRFDRRHAQVFVFIRDALPERRDAQVFPQGFSAIVDRLGTFKGVTLLADIGNGTMNLLYLRNGKPDSLAMFTEKFGTQQCVQAIRAAMMDRFQTVIDDFTIQEVLQTGTADIQKDYLTLIRSVAEQYVAQIFQRLREHEYNPALMQLYVVGGGGCLIRNFGRYDRRRVTILDDICATAKGYEYLAERYLKKGVKL